MEERENLKTLIALPVEVNTMFFEVCPVGRLNLVDI